MVWNFFCHFFRDYCCKKCKTTWSGHFFGPFFMDFYSKKVRFSVFFHIKNVPFRIKSTCSRLFFLCSVYIFTEIFFYSKKVYSATVKRNKRNESVLNIFIAYILIIYLLIHFKSIGVFFKCSYILNVSMNVLAVLAIPI